MFDPQKVALPHMVQRTAARQASARRMRILHIILAATLLVLLAPERAFTAGQPQTSSAPLEPPLFSHAPGFHPTSFNLVLSTGEQGATILYTLDGSEPLLENVGGRTYHYKQHYPQFADSPVGALLDGQIETLVYAGALPIRDRAAEADRLTWYSTTYDLAPDYYTPAAPVFKGTVVRARVVREGAQPSSVVTRTFFVSAAGADRYQLPVVSLAISEDHLFGYEEGLYTAGIDFDQWRAANPQLEANGGVPANYHRSGDAWEYPLHMELFDGDAGLVFTQNLGFRIHGAWTRALPQKTLRLYARGEYDDSSAMAHAFFPGLAANGTGLPITNFQRLLLRNAGNDYTEISMRDGFIQTLVEPLRLDNQAYRPAIQFINGEYWGIIALRERIDRHYLAAHYAINPNDIVMLALNAELEEGEAEDVPVFLALRDYIASHDMADPQHYAYAAARMDMDNFILYNVIEIYIDNVDWPNNNVRYWRKRVRDGEVGNPDALPGHDGRWRWILYDLDTTFGVYRERIPFNSLAFATRHAGENDWSTILLRRLLANPDFRAQFISTFADQMNTTFLPQHAERSARRIDNLLQPSYAEHFQRWPNTFRTSIDAIVEFAQRRPAYMRQHLATYFGLPAPRAVQFGVLGANQGNLQVNTLRLAAGTPGAVQENNMLTWSGLYYPTVPVRVTAHARAGFEFAGWLELPNVSEPSITINPATQRTLTARFLPRADSLIYGQHLPLVQHHP